LRRIAATLGLEQDGPALASPRSCPDLVKARSWQHPRSVCGVSAPATGTGLQQRRELWREMAEIGFRGRPSIVRQWIRERRAAMPEARCRGPSLPAWPAPVGRRLARLLMTDLDELSDPDRLFISRLLAEQPALFITIEWAKTMRSVLRRKTEASLGALLDAGSDTLLSPFVASLRRDVDAVSAALAPPWTTSLVEGQISRLKMLKRTMYGRAGFPASSCACPSRRTKRQHGKCGRAQKSPVSADHHLPKRVRPKVILAFPLAV
jgi:hypothetical protein